MATYRDNLRTTGEIEPLNLKEHEGRKLNINQDDSETEETESSGSSWSTLTSSQKLRRMKTQLVTAIAVSWVSLIIGYVSGYTSPAELSLRKDLEITEFEFSWIGGLMPLGAFVGGILGGPMIEYIGRKYTLLITDVVFLVAWIINFFATHYGYMYASRSLLGISVGIASLTLPVYLGETIQPEVRGSLGLLPTAFGNIGILMCYLLGTLFEWKNLAAVATLLCLPFVLVFIWIIKETPRHLVSKGKDDQAQDVLKWLRSENQNIDREFKDLKRSKEDSDKESKLADLFCKANMKPLAVCLGLMLFQQFSGINAVVFYTTNIFTMSGSTLAPSVCTLIVGIVNFISTFIATGLIDRLGRKMLLYISSIAMISTLLALGIYFYLMNVKNLDTTDFSWVPLVSFVLYVLGFSLGFGPIPWLMMGEILPAKIRGPAASLSTAFNWSCTFLVTKMFPIMIDAVGMHGTFWFFCVVTVIGFFFTLLCVPETRGKSLEDIERLMAGLDVRRRSSIANAKPMPSTLA